MYGNAKYQGGILLIVGDHFRSFRKSVHTHTVILVRD